MKKNITRRLTTSISPARRICTASGCRAARPVSHRINAWATAAGAAVTSPSAPTQAAAAGCIAPSTRRSVRSSGRTSFLTASSSFPTVSAIHYGNRLLMLHNGRIVLDISGEEKARLTVPDLLALFSKVSGQEYDNDRALLA